MDAKLIQARAEIEAILKKLDIAGHVVLHNAPGNSEVFMNITPSYSKLSEYAVTHDEVAYRLRSKLSDYNGDAQAQRRDLEATANLVQSIAMALSHEGLAMLTLAEQINQALNASHGPAMRTEGRAH